MDTIKITFTKNGSDYTEYTKEFILQEGYTDDTVFSTLNTIGEKINTIR